MSFNGSGTFLINSTGQPVVANTVISATVFNALTADLASGLTNCITKDGQSTPTANIPMGSNKITGLANGTLIGDAANLGQVQSTVAKLISITGTDTVLGTMSPTLTAYAAGQLFYFVAGGANTGAVTLNVDGLGAKAITRDGSTALAAGDINSGEIVVVIYDGTRFQMINAANSFGNTTINGTLTVTGNTGLQANVSVTSALSVGGTFAVTGAATLGSTLAVTGKSDLPTVSTASANAAVAVITDLSAAGASITSANVGTAVVTNGTVTNLTATSASVASANVGVALITTGTVTTLTATGASVASANVGTAVVTGLTVTGASIASMNGVTANITNVNATTVDATNVEVTNVKAKDGTAAIVISDTSGNVGIGGTPGAETKIDVLGTYPTNLGFSIGLAQKGTIPSGTVTLAAMFNTFPSTQAASFTLSDLVHYRTNQDTFGAGSTVTNQYGFLANGNLTGATNNYGFYGNIASGTNRYNVYMAGTADNYFAGNVGIGATSPGAKLDLGTDVTAQKLFVFRSSNSKAGFGVQSGDFRSFAPSDAAMTFGQISVSDGTTYTERMRIDSSGNVGIGGTADADVKTQIKGTLPTSSNTSIGIASSGTSPSGSTSAAYGFLSNFSTAAASFTLTDQLHFYANPVAKGAGSTIGNQYGFFASSGLTEATNNFGFYSNIASGSNRWNFYANGTADNYFAGYTGIGTTSASTQAGLSVIKYYASGGQNYSFRTSDGINSTLWVGHQSGLSNIITDQALAFYSASTERMRITAAGNIVAGASAALATTATDGFLYVPTCAGTPTGTPTAITGMAPIVVDTTNNKLYFYSTGQWRDAGP
jgi:hypothetical protein